MIKTVLINHANRDLDRAELFGLKTRLNDHLFDHSRIKLKHNEKKITISGDFEVFDQEDEVLIER